MGKESEKGSEERVVRWRAARPQPARPALGPSDSSHRARAQARARVLIRVGPMQISRHSDHECSACCKSTPGLKAP